MLSLALLWLFRLVHILSGVFWVGGVLIFSQFVFPAARALGPAGGPVMDQLTRVRQLPRALLTAGGLTVVSGVALYWHDSMGFTGAWMGTLTGMILGGGGLAAIVAIVIGLTINAPTAKRLGALAARVQAQGTPPTPDQAAEAQRLQHRLGSALRAVSALLVLATAAMALGRYVT